MPEESAFFLGLAKKQIPRCARDDNEKCFFRNLQKRSISFVSVQTMNRRDLLTLGIKRRTSSVELSCERLYMKFCDSNLDNTTQELFERLENELAGVEQVHLTDTAWLASRDFRMHLEPLLFSIRARGGRVTPFSEVLPNPNRIL